MRILRTYVSGLFDAMLEFLFAPRRAVVIAISTSLIIGIVAIGVMKVRGAQSESDAKGLTGKVFFIRSDLNSNTPGSGWKRYVGVMNANGTDSRILVDEFASARYLTWYPKLDRLGVFKVSNERFMAGNYTLRITGQSAINLSVDKIERSIPDDFSTKFFDPAWAYKDGRYTLLPNSRTYSTRITFSPDGKWIAGLVDIMDAESNQTKLRMCVVPTDQSAPESCDLSVEGCPTQSPEWSPDGTKVVFAGAFKDESMTQACNSMELYVANADMKKSYQLTNIVGPKIPEDNHGLVKPGMKPGFSHKSSYPRWSRDGHWIAFMSYGGIYRVRPDGTGLQLVIRDGYYPAWSPDGTMLMYVVLKGSPFATSGSGDRIFVAHADGSDQTEIPLNDQGPGRYKYSDLNWAE
jgi:Tol biopolymer transport system component